MAMGIATRWHRSLLGAAVTLTLLGGTSCGPSANMLYDATCAGTLVTGATGTVSDPILDEVSGVVDSTANAGVLWVHNDSGDSARLFALTAAGTVLGTFTVTGASAQDWEDLAQGPGPVEGQRYLYAGDIGDNALARASIAVYRIPEPVVDADAAPVGTVAMSGMNKLTFTYPDGAHNAETLLVDTDGAIYVVTKQSGSATIFRAPPGLAGGSSTVLENVGTVAINAGALLTGGDIAPAGDAIALRTYGQVYIYQRSAGSTIAATLAGARCAGAYTVEPQGEAIAFLSDAQSYITMSEGVGRPINQYRVP